MSKTERNETAEEVAGAAACPICGRPRRSEHRPFCSRRCADVDLNRWLSGGYVIATPIGPVGEGESA